MSSVKPVHLEMTVAKSVSEVRSALTSKVSLLKGRIVGSNDTGLECKFGSLLVSRLLGELWVPKATLPKRATIKIEEVQENQTRVTLDVRDAHKWGVKWGYMTKYERALEELADSLLFGL